MSFDLTDRLRTHWDLNPEVVQLNHGSFGACPRVVLETQAELRRRMEHEPVVFLGRRLEAMLDEVRESLGGFLGAPPEDLGFVPNATTGVNAVVRSLDFEPGDEILVTDHGYNACTNVVDHVCARTGAKRVTAHLPFPIASADAAIEAILEVVTPRTKLLLIDHITSPTAIVLPVERIVPMLRERGIETVIDGAHAPGQVPLDLTELGAGYVTGNAHKWLCAPKGTAYLYVRRDLQDGLRPPVISHGANDGRTARSRFRIEFDWQGTTDPTAILTIPAAIQCLESMVDGGIAALQERNRALALKAREIVAEAFGATIPVPDDMVGSMAALHLPDRESVELLSAFDTVPEQDRLYDEHRVEVPIMQWPDPGRRLLRLSAQAYNGVEDYRRLADGLKAVFQAG